VNLYLAGSAAVPPELPRRTVSVRPVAAMLSWASSAVRVTPAGPVKPPVTVSVAVAGRPPPVSGVAEEARWPASPLVGERVLDGQADPGVGSREVDGAGGVAGRRAAGHVPEGQGGGGRVRDADARVAAQGGAVGRVPGRDGVGAGRPFTAVWG
jgi:hypothetical protein